MNNVRKYFTSFYYLPTREITGTFLNRTWVHWMKTEWHWVRSRVTRDRFWPRACEGLIAIPSDPTSHEGLSVFMNGLKFSWGWYFVQQSHNYLGIWVRSHFPLLLCPKKIGTVSDFGDVSTTDSTCRPALPVVVSQLCCKHVLSVLLEFGWKTHRFWRFSDHIVRICQVRSGADFVLILQTHLYPTRI